MPRLLTPDEIAAAVDGPTSPLPAWSLEGDPADTLVRSIEAPSFLGGIRLVVVVADVAESLNHHPDIDIRWTTVTFRLSTHSEGGLTEHDLEMAGRIDAVAESLAHDSTDS